MCLSIHMHVFGGNVWKSRNTNYFLHVLSSVLKSRKRGLCNGLAKLSSAVMWKAELLIDKLGYIVGESFKQSTGGSAWVLAAYNKTSKNSVT